MSNKLFVGGLSWGTDDEALRDAFSEFGDVSDVKVITDRETGRSRGFGFVTFANAAEAKAAISSMDGTTLDGRTINVNEAQDRRHNSSGDRGGHGGDRGGRGGGDRGGRGGGDRGGRRDNNRW
jgi:RNA recognition motif-containing protein